MSDHSRYHEEEEMEEPEGWMVSYSAVMTDLCAIFVMLFAFAMMTKGVDQTVVAQTGAFSGWDIGVMEGWPLFQQENGGTGIGPSGGQGGTGTGTGTGQEDSAIDQFIKDLNSQLPEDWDKEIIVQSDLMFTIRMADSVLFDTGSADITPAAENILNELFKTLENHKNEIKMLRIEGHTDNVPISGGRFQDNWQLSTARAESVMRLLFRTTTFKGDRVSYAGYGEFRPVASNATPENRQKNRRIELVVETVK